MKRTIKTNCIFGALLAAAALVSCQKETAVTDNSISEGEQITVIANLDEAKTTNDGIHTNWKKDDKIRVFYNASDKASTVYNSALTWSETGNKFTGTLSNLSKTANDFYFVYPNKNDKKLAEYPVTIKATLEQKGNNSPAHICGENFPIIGKNLAAPYQKEATYVANMKNALCLAVFKVTNTTSSPITVSEIEFTSTSNIVGEYKLNLKTEAWTASKNCSKTVKINVKEGTSIAAGATAEFYAGVVPHTVKNGETLTFKVTAKHDGALAKTCTIEKVMTKDQAFSAGSRKFINLDFSEKIDRYQLLTEVPANWDGKYIFVSASKKFVFTGSKTSPNKYELQSADWQDGDIVIDGSDYEFTISKDGDKYYLKHDGKYLYCAYSGEGDGSTGLAYSSDAHSLALEYMTDGTFGFWMEQGGVNQCVYYKTINDTNYFKFGGSHENHCIYLYKFVSK